MNHISRDGALEQLAELILETEKDNYVDWCKEQDLNPIHIKGCLESEHPYALALIGLGLEFEG